MKPSDKVFFLHLRHFDDGGNVLGKGGMTLAYRVADDNTGVFRLTIGKAVCCEKDNFCRSYGRSLAQQRIDQPHKISFQGIDLNGELMTRHTKRKDVNIALSNWAYGN